MAWSWQLYPCKGQPSPRVMKTIARYFKDWMDERDKMFAHSAEIQDHCEVSSYRNIHVFQVFENGLPIYWKWNGLPSKGEWDAYHCRDPSKDCGCGIHRQVTSSAEQLVAKSMGSPVTWVGSESQLHIGSLLLTFISSYGLLTWTHSPIHLHLVSWIHRYYLYFSNLDEDMNHLNLGPC